MKHLLLYEWIAQLVRRCTFNPKVYNIAGSKHTDVRENRYNWKTHTLDVRNSNYQILEKRLSIQS